MLDSDFKDDTPMSYEEKREVISFMFIRFEKSIIQAKLQLSANMNKLPGKKLGAVVQIIHDRNPKILQQVVDSFLR